MWSMWQTKLLTCDSTWCVFGRNDGRIGHSSCWVLRWKASAAYRTRFLQRSMTILTHLLLRAINSFCFYTLSTQLIPLIDSFDPIWNRDMITRTLPQNTFYVKKEEFTTAFICDSRKLILSRDDQWMTINAQTSFVNTKRSTITGMRIVMLVHQRKGGRLGSWMDS